MSAEAATAFDDITRDGRVNQLSGQSPNDWPNTFRTSRFIPAVEYLRAQRARTLLMREMEKLMSQWDVFVSPAPGSASLLVTNLTGHPAVLVSYRFNGFLDDIYATLVVRLHHTDSFEADDLTRRTTPVQSPQRLRADEMMFF